MASKTFLGRDMFAAYWGFVLCATLESNRLSRSSFEVALREFVEEQGAELERILEVIQHTTGLEDDIMRIAVDEAPWRSRAAPLDEAALCAELSLHLGRWVDAQELSEPSVGSLL